MTTGRINQVASALPRASSPAGRAPVRRRDVAFRRRRGGGRKGETGGSSRDPHEPGTAAPAPAPPLVSPRPAIRPPGRRGPAWCAAPTPERARPPVPHRVRGRPPGRGRRSRHVPRTSAPRGVPGGAPHQAALCEDGRAPRGSGSEASGHRSSKPFRRGGDGRRRPAARGPPDGCSGGIARAPPAAAWAAAGPRAPQQETKPAGGAGQPAGNLTTRGAEGGCRGRHIPPLPSRSCEAVQWATAPPTIAGNNTCRPCRAPRAARRLRGLPPIRGLMTAQARERAP